MSKHLFVSLPHGTVRIDTATRVAAKIQADRSRESRMKARLAKLNIWEGGSGAGKFQAVGS